MKPLFIEVIVDFDIERYQVVIDKKAYKVSELTKPELQQELCKAMFLIERIENELLDSSAAIKTYMSGG